MASLSVLFLLLWAVAATTIEATFPSRLGINYGQLGVNLPSPTRSIALITSIRAGAVKLYDANPDILSALSFTPLHVSIMVPNGLIPSLTNQAAADSWVTANILPFNSTVRIRYLLVGNEVLSDASLRDTVWPALVPAIWNLHRSLTTNGIRNIKLGTPLAMDALSASYPPSQATFRPDVSGPIIAPLLQFLQRTRSFFFMDVYPYFVYAANPGYVSLDYALLNPSAAAASYTDPASGLRYANMLEQQLDAVASGMAKLGFPSVRLAIAETGWPNAGGSTDPGATVRNAAVYNRNLARWVAHGAGTPMRPGARIPTFLFSLYDEDQKSGPETERHWGVFYGNGTAAYGIDLSGRTEDSRFSPVLDAAGREHHHH